MKIGTEFPKLASARLKCNNSATTFDNLMLKDQVYQSST